MRVPHHIPLRTGGSLSLEHGCRHFLLTPPQQKLPQIWQRLAVRPATFAYAIGKPTQGRSFSKTTAPRSASVTAGSSTTVRPGNASNTQPRQPQQGYFLSNNVLERVSDLNKNPFQSPSSPSLGAHGTAELPPHRRRQATRRRAQPHLQPSANTTPPSSAHNASDADLPANASTILTDMAASHPTTSFRRLASTLLSLAKPRLTVLVVLSAMVSYAMYPVPSFLSPELLETATTPSLSPLTLLFLTLGTALCSASANTLNMLYELDTDALMSRTRNRPLVRMLVSRPAALVFAVACGFIGTLALHFGVNSTTAFLGAANIALYAGVYTPMKRLSVVNTWVGALVGGIPPLMGWAAAAGESATGLRSTGGTNGTQREPEFRELLFAPDGSSIGGWLFACLLFSWEFPHFMALSWSVRNEYRKAGLRMLSWVNPARNGRVALRYSLTFIPICVGLCAVGVTEWSFAVTSLPVNLWLVRDAYRFWHSEGYHGSARGLFWASVWHLPVIMVLALLQKKGMWARVWRSVAGAPDLTDEDEDEDGEYDDDDDNYDVEGNKAGGRQPIA